MTAANRAEPAGSEHAGFLGLVDLARLLWRRCYVVLATVALFTAVATLAAFLLPPQYTAVATALVQGQDPEVLSITNVLRTPPQDKPMMATNVELLSARSFAGRIVDELNLTADPEFNPALPGGPRFADWLEDTAVRVIASLPPQAALAADLFSSPPLSAEAQREYSLEQLRLQTQVEQAGEAYTIAIRVTSFDQKKAAVIANKMVESFIEERLEAKRIAIEAAADWLNARLGELRQRLTHSEGAVADFRAGEGLTEASDRNPLLRQMDQITVHLVLAEARRAQAEARLNQAEQLTTSQDQVRLATRLFSSPLLLESRGQEATLEREAAELATTYGPRHPRMLDINAELETVRSRQIEEFGRILNDIRTEVLVARAEENQLSSRLSELEVAAREQENAATPIFELQRQADADRAIYMTFLSRFKEVTEQLDIAEPGVQAVSAASPPRTPSFPLKSLLIGGTFSGSLIVGVVVALIVELFDTGLRTARQVESTLGVPALTLVPRVPRRRTRRQPLHRYIVANPRSSFAEALRNLKVEILQSDVDRPPKVVLITSALPGEGKTTLALCLGVVAAVDGLRTLIVDLDLHRAALRKPLGVPEATPGVLECLMGECALEDALFVDPHVSTLRALTVHRATANPSAIFGSQRMAELIATLRPRFDLIIFDSPPTLAVGDARVLAALADAVLFVVRWGATHADAGRAGVEKLHDIRPPIVGVAINQVDLRRHASRVYGDALQYYRQVSYYHSD